MAIVFALSLTLVTRIYAFEPRGVRQSSMYPTIEDHDRVFINKMCYYTSKPNRGDVIVFHPNKGSGDDLIKRVIGLPGESISISGDDVYINGKLFVEDLDKQKTDYKQDFNETPEISEKGIKLDSDEYYVVGDNRNVSMDSRSFGPIKSSQIVGKAFFVFWPLDHVGLIK
ncbi:MAG: signal peptidase I [Caldisericia bacterium]